MSANEPNTKATFLMGEKPVESSFFRGQSSGISMRELVHYNNNNSNETFFTPIETSFLLNSLLSPHQPSTSSHTNYNDVQSVIVSNNFNDFSPSLPKPTPLYPGEIFNAAVQLAVSALINFSNCAKIQQNGSGIDAVVAASNKFNKLNSAPAEYSNAISENCNESLNNLNLRNENVIQNSLPIVFHSSLAAPSLILPTCAEPKIYSDLLTTKNKKDPQEECPDFSSSWSQSSSSALSSSSASNKGTRTLKCNSNNRLSYPREFKLMVIERYMANGRNKYRTCKEFQITKSMLNGWLQKAEKIRNSRPGSLKSGRSGRRPLFPAIEKQLFQLYSERQKLLCSQHINDNNTNTNSSSRNSNGSSASGRSNRSSAKSAKISNRWIRETAKQLARQQCSEQELLGMCQFSERWLTNFKKRYLISAKQIPA